MAVLRTSLLVAAAAHATHCHALSWSKHGLPLQGGQVLTDVHAIYEPKTDSIVAYTTGEAGLLLKLDRVPAKVAAPKWSLSLDLSFPFYFYGVYSWDENTTLVSGFVDGSGGSYGIVQYTEDGGRSWSNDTRTDAAGTWGGGPIEFIGDEGLMLSNSANNVWRTSSGGQKWADWVEVPAGDGQWHAGDYVWDQTGSGDAWVAGSALCHSTDFGSTWSCGSSIDSSGIDSGLACTNATGVCLVGGGEIDPDVAGWVHVSTSGPNPSSFNQARALNAAFPIRSVLAVQPKKGGAGSAPILIAAGGNYFSSVGGIYSSSDLGNTWTLDMNLGQEVKACRSLVVPSLGVTRVYCVSAGSQGASIVSADI